MAAWKASIEGRLVDVEALCSLIKSRDVCIVGSSSSLYGEVGLLDSCDAIVAADGAAAFLAERVGVTADIVVTDLDGPLGSLMRLFNEGSLPLLYFHGDNYATAYWVSGLLPAVGVSAQCVKPGWPVLPATGFTDGDRALWLAVCCEPRSVTLLGMDTRASSAAGTKLWLRRDASPGYVKRVKLRVAEKLIGAGLAYAWWRSGGGKG